MPRRSHGLVVIDRVVSAVPVVPGWFTYLWTVNLTRGVQLTSTVRVRVNTPPVIAPPPPSALTLTLPTNVVSLSVPSSTDDMSDIVSASWTIAPTRPASRARRAGRRSGPLESHWGP